MSYMPYKLVFFKLIFFLVECLHNFQLLPQDFADSLASHVSVTLNGCVLVILMTKMFFFGTIECLSPSEWPEPWEKAAEAICLTDGTYRLQDGLVNGTVNGTEWDNRLSVGYYYWIPYIFMGQAVILKAPDFLWHFYCDLNTKKPLEIIKAFAFLVGNQEIIRHGNEAKVEPVLLTNCVLRKKWTDRLASHLLSRNELVNFDNCHLFVVYMFSKLLRIAALIGSMFYLQRAFGLDSPLFGFTLASNFLLGLSWEETNLFPRWAYCDLRMKYLDNWNSRVVQCALPINLLLERLLPLVWFWLLLCIVCLLLSAGAWIVAMLPVSRRQFANSFLNYLSANGHFEEQQYTRKKLFKKKKQLMRVFTGFDRAFMLRLAEERLGLAAVYLAMDGMANLSNEIVV